MWLWSEEIYGSDILIAASSRRYRSCFPQAAWRPLVWTDHTREKLRSGTNYGTMDIFSFTTSPFLAKDFEKSAYIQSVSDQGVDDGGTERYDRLVITVEINVSVEGYREIRAELTANDGTHLDIPVSGAAIYPGRLHRTDGIPSQHHHKQRQGWSIQCSHHPR